MEQRQTEQSPSSGEQDSALVYEDVVRNDRSKFEIEKLGIRMTIEFPTIEKMSREARETLESLTWDTFGRFCTDLGNTGLANFTPDPKAFLKKEIRTW